MIREYVDSDKPEVLNLLLSNMPKYFDPKEAKDFEEYLDFKREMYYIVISDNTIIGAGGINYFPEERTARLSWDIIHPGYQERSIGRKLTEHRIKQIEIKGNTGSIVARTTHSLRRNFIGEEIVNKVS
jgi:[ribosomal protein S18]-alanine N-acetyltransferase